jgi:phenylpyruvate tautomerase PptA (4-oxalocrotonate tautomerase family)
MPILDVEIVDRPGASLAPDLAQCLADRAGDALGAPPGTTWVTVSLTPSTRYAESGGSEGGYLPVFVRVLKQSLPVGPAHTAEVAALTRAVGEATGRARDQVHVIYEPPGRGRVAFGGILVE